MDIFRNGLQLLVDAKWIDSFKENPDGTWEIQPCRPLNWTKLQLNPFSIDEIDLRHTNFKSRQVLDGLCEILRKFGHDQLEKFLTGNQKEFIIRLIDNVLIRIQK